MKEIRSSTIENRVFFRDVQVHNVFIFVIQSNEIRIQKSRSEENQPIQIFLKNPRLNPINEKPPDHPAVFSFTGHGYANYRGAIWKVKLLSA